MKDDREGFSYPVINEDLCIHCDACVKVCPLKKEQTKTDTSLFIAAKNLSDEVRKSSSSGGVFTAISDWVLKQNGVIYGVVYDRDFSAMHARAETPQERDAMRVSKYLQSRMDDTFQNVKTDLATGRLVLFTGTPCQVDGLKSFLKKEYDNLITADVVCHGVPSPLMFAEHIQHLQNVKKSKVVAYACRSKELGWHRHIEKATFQNGKVEYGTPLGQEHKTLFYAGHILRPSCYECHYSNLQRPSDITLADFWGVEKCMPEYADQIGISLLLVNNKKGEKILAEIASCLEYRKSTSFGRQPNLERSSDRPPNREAFWNLYFSRGYKAVAAKYGRNGFKQNLKYRIKKLLKM